MSNSGKRPSKRMRLGTRSCGECRRRKVRCIYPEDEHVCKACEAHGSVCKPQGTSNDQGTEDTVSTQSDVHQRLETLQSLLGRVRNRLEANGDSSFEAGDSNLAELLDAPTLASQANSHGATERSQDKTGDVSESISTIPLLLDGPLLRAFKEALVMEPQSVAWEVRTTSASTSNKPLSDVLRGYLPSQSLLHDMLEASKPYWFLWPVPPGTGDRHLASASEQVTQYLGSRRALWLAKALLWLTLATQQLIGPNRRLINDFDITQGDLAALYFSTAINALPHDFKPSDLRDGLDCLMLQCKVYINLGRPHKAWQMAREAIAAGLLLGLDRSTNADGQGRALLQMSWQYERNLSLIVSLPPSISESDRCISAKTNSDNWYAHAMRDVSVIAGRLAERDRAGGLAVYATTAGIEAELQSLCHRVPADAWLKQLPAGLTAAQYFGQYQLELYIHCHRKALHMPFAFKDGSSENYAESRQLTFDSARAICEAFQTMRAKTEGWLMMCDLADFQVFTGAATLVLGLLNPTLMPAHHDRDADWQLVDSITAHFRQIQKLVDCTVAGQAAELLERLSLARQGFLSEDEDAVVAVPYFGTFRIRRKAPEQCKVDIHPDQSRDNTALDTLFGDVEFDASLFDSCDGGQSAYCGLSDVELGADWFAGWADGACVDGSGHN